MLEHQLNNKLNSKEDELTSTIIGLLKYLPAEVFWSIIKKSCFQNTNIPETSGILESITFWAKWNAENTTNSRYVEPDVFLRFKEFDVIIEVKPYDNQGQYREQWENQIQAYKNEYQSEKELYFIALGGNGSKVNNKLPCSDGRDIIINKCDWLSILIEVSTILKQLKQIDVILPNKESIIRILEDVIKGFSLFGYYNIKWFNKLNTYNIQNYNFKSISYE